MNPLKTKTDHTPHHTPAFTLLEMLLVIAINPTSQTVMLTAPNSVEYGLTPVQLGTTVLVGGGAFIDYSCNMPTNVECWSASSPGFMPWGPIGIITGATNEDSGYNNTQTLYNMGSEYAAAHYCATLDDSTYPVGTWYLPAKNQLWAAYEAGPPTSDLFSGSNHWWSSSEWSNDHGIYLNLFGGSWMTSFSKANNAKVRCLR